MKIAMLTENPLFFGGGENYAYEISRYLAEYGHNIDFIQLYGFPKKRSFKSTSPFIHSRWLKVPTSKVFYFIYSRMLWLYSFFSIPLITWNLVKGKYDIIHVNGFGYSSLLISAVLAKKINGPRVFGTLHNDLLKPIDRNFVQILVSNVDMFLAVSPSIQKSWLTHFNSNALFIPNGVDISRFNHKVDGSKIRKRLNLGNKFVVLSVGRLSKQKGLFYLIQAVFLLKKEIPNLIVLICGRGEEEQRLKKLVNDLELTQLIFFLGYIPEDELPFYYAACDVFVLPSVFETFALTLLEALSMGKPTVCAKVGGAQQVATQFEANYFAKLVKPQDAVDLAKGILWYYQNPKFLINDKFKKDVEEKIKHYSWAGVAKQINSLYELSLRK